MPFRSFTDPIDLARANAADEAAWAIILANPHEFLGAAEMERERLKFIVASLLPMALDEADLVAQAVAQFTGKAANEIPADGANPPEPSGI